MPDSNSSAATTLLVSRWLRGCTFLDGGATSSNMPRPAAVATPERTNPVPDGGLQFKVCLEIKLITRLLFFQK